MEMVLSVYMPLPNVVLVICELVNNVKIRSQQQLHLPTDLHLGLLTSYEFFFLKKKSIFRHREQRGSSPKCNGVS